MTQRAFARWGEFFEELQEEQRDLKLRTGEECFFRGQADLNWPLEPSLHRHCHSVGIQSPDQIRQLEANLFFEFRRRAREMQSQDWSAWDILFAMRHHGVATRLLDWTEVPAVAVFFALRSASQTQNPCVWLLNPYALNEWSFDEHDLIGPDYLGAERGDYEDLLVGDDPAFPWKLPVALYPLQRTARIFAQQGYFTIHGHDPNPIDAQVPDFVRKVPIPGELIGTASDFLETVGINEYSLFADLDNLAAYLNRKYGIGAPNPKLLDPPQAAMKDGR